MCSCKKLGALMQQQPQPQQPSNNGTSNSATNQAQSKNTQVVVRGVIRKKG
jgi:hypothetical protein